MKQKSLFRKKLFAASHLILMTLAMISFHPEAKAQLTPFETWTTTSGTQNFFVRSKTVTDGSGNVYIAGGTVNGNGNYDILVSKINNAGVVQWTQQMDGLAGFQDGATALCIDGSGNVYITGFIADTLAHGTDVITIKYNSSGTQQWATRYNGVGNFHDFGSDIYADGSGNVYVVGSSQNAVPNADFLVIKYNSSGIKVWRNIYNYTTANLDDAGFRIKSVSAGKITVAGVIQLTSNSYAYGHLSYNTSTGTIIGNLSMGTASSDIAREFAYSQDADGNTYLAGAIDNGPGNGLDYCIIKFDTSAAIVWESHYNGADGLEDVATDVVIDVDGNVYATGYTTTTTEATNFTTLKFDPLGDLIWERHYNGEGNGADTAMAMTLHSDTTFILTGSSFNGSNQDYYTMKYDTTGAILWEINYNSHYNRSDGAHSIAISDDNSIIVTGQSYDDVSLNYTTIRYIEPWIMDTLTDGIPLGSGFSFIENRGQIINTDEDEMPGIRFYNNQQQYSSYFTDTLISYVFSAIDTTTATDDTLYRVDLRFINPTIKARVYGKDKLSEYNNFYLPQTAPDGRERVPLYKELYMPSLWTNIDLKITSNPAGIKYAFILYPGFDPEQPSFSIEGYDDLATHEHNGILTAETSLGDLNLFLAQEVFQIDENGDHIPLGWRPGFDLDHNIVTFNSFDTYDPGLPLVIVMEEEFAGLNPNADYLCWSTHFGGNQSDLAYAVSTDDIGNQYMAGTTQSDALTFPVFNGQYMAPMSPDWQAFAAKFFVNHQRAWVTFFGGTDANEGKDIKCKSTGEVYLVGMTEASDFPVWSKAGAYNQPTWGGNKDGFIAEFDQFGFAIWSTWLGGSEDDAINSIDFDDDGNFFLVGYCGSDFPTETLSGFHDQGSYGGGVSDAFVAKFDSADDKIWATFYGGSNEDYGQSLKIDALDNIFVQGTTYSGNFPIEDPGGDAFFDNSLGGAMDDWILKFDVSGSREWATFIGGSNLELNLSIPGPNSPGNRIDFDKQNHIYLVGSTYSNNFPITNLGGYCESTWYDNCGYIMKFDKTTYEPLWTSFLSAEGKTYVNAISIDHEDGIFVAGATSDPQFPLMQIAGQFYQDTQLGTISNPFSGNIDACILAFDVNTNQLFGTYFGGYQTGSFGEVIPDIATFNDELYFTGWTQANGIGATELIPIKDPGNNAYYDDSYNGAGSADAFISMICTGNITAINEDANNSLSFQIYPNPSSNELNIIVNNVMHEQAILTISDITGRLVRMETKFISGNKIPLEQNISMLNEGVYLVNLTIGERTFSSRFVKIK